jgi:integrase
VFPSERGTPLEPTSLLLQFAALLKRADLPHVRFHDLRHTCASFLVAEKVHPRVAKEILRHARISTTMELYAHVTEQDEREATDKVADMLSLPLEPPEKAAQE